MTPRAQIRWIIVAQVALCVIQVWSAAVYGTWGLIANIGALLATLVAWNSVRRRQER